MRPSEKQEHCIRTILLIITGSACISIVVYIFLQFTGQEKYLKDEIPKGNLFQTEKLTEEKCIPVCDSRNCIIQADILLRNIKPSADPCENFQKFLCGSYEENFARDESSTILTNMEVKMRKQLKNLIENVDAKPESASGKMKMMYESCINTGSEVDGIETFRQFLNSVGIFQWPQLALNFEFSEDSLPIILGILQSYLAIRFIGFGVYSASGNGTEMMEKYVNVIVHQSLLNETSFIQRDVATDILNYFEIEPEDIETVLNDHDAVKRFLTNFFEEKEDECGENCFTKVLIDCSSPEDIDSAYLCEMVEVYLNITDLNQYVSKSKIAVDRYDVYHAKNLIPRLKTLSERSVANFFALNILWQHLDEINFFFRQKKQKYFEYFKSDLKRTQAPFSNKWEYCVTWIIENMRNILEKEFVKSYLSKSSVDEIHDIHQNYTSVVANMLTRQKWIPFIPKVFMRHHITELKCNMEYIQQHLHNDTHFNDLLKTFNPTASFLHNVLDYLKSFSNSYSRLEIDIERRAEPEFIANAGTELEENIELNYGIFIPPVYYPGEKRFTNHILLAPIIVHEIGHNIVYLLANFFNQDEVTRSASDEFKEAYMQRKLCIENQFSNFKFKISDENLNGTRYFPENLSDNLGFTVVDKVIKELWTSEEVFRLPGLPYSPEQLLFMNSRQIFCSKDNRKQEEIFKTKEKHAPMEYRIIGSVQNSKEFSEIFSCPEGSYMNPTEKCIFLDSA